MAKNPPLPQTPALQGTSQIPTRGWGLWGWRAEKTWLKLKRGSAEVSRCTSLGARREAPTGILQIQKTEWGVSKNEPLVPGLLLDLGESQVLGICGRPRGDEGHLQGAGTATLGHRGGCCRKQGTCPSHDEKDLVGLLHSLTMTLRSFCKMHISRLCPNQATETPECCLSSLCNGAKEAWAGGLSVPPLLTWGLKTETRGAQAGRGRGIGDLGPPLPPAHNYV